MAIKWVTKMAFLRNPEVKKSWLIFLCMSLLMTAGAFWMDKLMGFYMIGCLGLIHLWYLIVTYKRYRSISNLSVQIDRVLHGDYGIDVGEFNEGELAILKHDIYKVTLRLREQAEALKKEKINLANSLADISHQLRTPLTSMNMVVAFLGNEKTSENKRKEMVRELNVLLRRMDWLITSLLKISKLDAGTASFNKRTIYLRDVFRQAMEPLSVIMDLRNHRICFNGDMESKIEADFGWTVEAVSNILKNAMEHMDDSGKIMVEFLENPLYVECTIKDNGKGIDAEDLPYVFNRYFKGKNSRESSVGIGLALTKMIITEQDGTIKVENHPDGGVNFTIRFNKKSKLS